MIAPTQVYPSSTKSILVLFDLEDPGQREQLRVLVASFDERYAILEHLDSRFCCLHLLPGGTPALPRREPHLSGEQEATA
jgi:hypothetical protein